MLTPKFILGTIVIAVIVLLAWASNHALETFGIANAEAFTIEQRKENAREHWYEWDHHQFK